MQSHGLCMTPVSIITLKVNSQQKSRWTQKAFRNKTGRQTHKGVWTRIRQYHQTWRPESCVYKSWRGGWNILSYNNRDSRSTKRDQWYNTRKMLNHQKRDICFQLIEDKKVLWKDNKLIIPASLQHRVFSWYHHYLQHLEHSWLKETMRSVMYWKYMHNIIRTYVKPCRSCHVSKRHS